MSARMGRMKNNQPSHIDYNHQGMRGKFTIPSFNGSYDGEKYLDWLIESPILVLDNWWNLGTNPCTKCVDMKGWSHAKWWSKRTITVDGGDQKMIKCFIFRKEEREKQKWAQGKGILIGAIFCLHSRHHRGCEWFRIDSYTIKRGSLMVNTVVKCH